MDYTPSPPIFSADNVIAMESLWNIKVIHAPELWDLGYMGQGVVVASMDTGVDINHPDLAVKWRGGNNSWFDPHEQHKVPTDVDGHGTLTMGIVVGGDSEGTTIGIAPRAKWIAIKMFDDDRQAFLSSVHIGFQWLLDPDGNPDTDDAPDIVCCPWGFADSPGLYISDLRNDIQVLKTAGIAAVFSAGNKGPAESTSQSPANYPESFAVGAILPNNNVVPGSSRGPSSYDGSIYPKVVAPGFNIRTSCVSNNEQQARYTYVGGTSVAVPHVVGAMALLLSVFPNLSVEVLESALLQSAQDLGVPGPDNEYGYGLVDILETYFNLLLSSNGSDSFEAHPQETTLHKGRNSTQDKTQSSESLKAYNKQFNMPKEKAGKYVLSEFDEVLVKRLELVPTLKFNAPHLWDIVAYLRKDNHIIKTIDKTSLDELVHQRYSLNTKNDIELALTDLYELARLCNTSFYRSHWPKRKCLSFIKATLEQILKKNSHDYPAFLLKSYVMFEGGGQQEAIEIYKSVCKEIKQRNFTTVFTELTLIASWLLSCDQMSSENKQLIKGLVYEAGLSPDSPLAQYMEGKHTDVSLNTFRVKKDPFDLSESINHPNSARDIAEGRHYIDPKSLKTEKQRIEYWGLRVNLLYIEKDPRGLIELSRLLEATDAPKLSYLLCLALAHKLAGRHSVAIPLLESMVLSEDCKQTPGLLMSLQNKLGMIYYEQGDYNKAKEKLGVVVTYPKLSAERRTKLLRILSEIEK